MIHIIYIVIIFIILYRGSRINAKSEKAIKEYQHMVKKYREGLGLK